ncbi:hypothetical protein HUZ36_11310 [Pseudoalteromonas sp. McH1-7]|uniref:hypothetical protein n=1 Tax=unclassified Pseudoalteromonas TaxID=194690 RepID=UPI001591B5B7|nr:MULTISPECIES: hypothetical protein [unclassified Pseudoalteromonas]NUZ11367.1 hypothetical protein [Pseudoalteromonas sp. McH1-7]USD28725.1 hypothetical protein J8Z24_01030 [Pseudoalteromonas sp. SCSIO 43201]
MKLKKRNILNLKPTMLKQVSGGGTGGDGAQPRAQYIQMTIKPQGGGSDGAQPTVSK